MSLLYSHVGEEKRLLVQSYISLVIFALFYEVHFKFQSLFIPTVDIIIYHFSLMGRKLVKYKDNPTVNVC
jgi:hypothetical protein